MSRKSDAQPSYVLAAVVYDHQFAIYRIILMAVVTAIMIVRMLWPTPGVPADS